MNSLMNSKMIGKKNGRYRLMQDSNPSNLINFGDYAKSLRYGIGIRVMDFYWVSGGSVANHWLLGKSWTIFLIERILGLPAL